jgi:hypothetical protein
MATPRLTPEQIAQVSGLVAQYIATQRERYASRAVCTTEGCYLATFHLQQCSQIINRENLGLQVHLSLSPFLR